MISKKVDVIGEINESQKANYHRGKSWEHCYVFFRNHRKFSNNEELLDSAALHLGFFMASCGMLRGSSFLLQKDFKFYIPLVKVLTSSKYDRLWDVNFIENSRRQDIEVLFQLKEEIERKINENNKLDGDVGKHELNLIITKILMATLGCVPGYDRYFKDGLKERYRDKEIKKYSNFDKEESFENFLNLVRKDKELMELCKKSHSIKEDKSANYPPMKLLDLYFWILGYPKDKLEQLEQ